MKKLLEFLVGLVKVLFGGGSESPAPEKPRETPEIGRASCRERV